VLDGESELFQSLPEKATYIKIKISPNVIIGTI